MKYEFLREYSRLKACCTDTERAEIEVTEAQYQFGMSTGTGLLIIAFLYLILHITSLLNRTDSNIFYIEPRNEISDILLIILIFAIPTLLMLGARFYNHGVRLPLICSFMAAYTGEVCITEVCRNSDRRRATSDGKRARKMYKKAEDKVKEINEKHKLNKIVEPGIEPTNRIKKVEDDEDQYNEIFDLLERAFTLDREFVKKKMHADRDIIFGSLKDKERFRNILDHCS
jgi:hypothetical protein